MQNSENRCLQQILHLHNCILKFLLYQINYYILELIQSMSQQDQISSITADSNVKTCFMLYEETHCSISVAKRFKGFA